jgi:hypothetical protein
VRWARRGLAGLGLALAPALATAAPGHLEVTLERATVRPSWQLEVEGLRIELLLPDAAPVGEMTEADASLPGGSAAPVRLATTLLVHEGRLAEPDDEGRAAISLSGTLERGGRTGEVELSGGLAPEAGRHPLDIPWDLALGLRGVDAEAVRQLLPAGWRISAASGVLDGHLDLAGRPRETVSGHLSVDLEQGNAEHAGIHHEAPLHFETAISFGAEPTRLSDAHVASASARVAGRTGTELRASFAYSEKVLDLAEGAFSIFGGTTQHHGRIHFTETPDFDLESHLRGIDVGQIFDNLDPELEPTLEWKSTLEGQWTGQDDWLNTLEGKVRLDLEGGSLPGSRVLQSISRALLSRVPGVAAQGKEPPPRTPIRHAGATFEVAQGRARTDDLEVVTGDYVLKAGGRIDADQSIELEGRVALTVTGVDSVLSMAGFGLEGLASLPVAPIRATGTLREPHFETDAADLPVRAWKLVPRTVGAARGAVEKGAGLVIDAAKGAGGLLHSGEAAPGQDEGEGR